MTYFSIQDLELIKATLEAFLSLKTIETDATRAMSALITKINAMIEERKKWGR